MGVRNWPAGRPQIRHVPSMPRYGPSGSGHRNLSPPARHSTCTFGRLLVTHSGLVAASGLRRPGSGRRYSESAQAVGDCGALPLVVEEQVAEGDTHPIGVSPEQTVSELGSPDLPAWTTTDKAPTGTSAVSNVRNRWRT